MMRSLLIMLTVLLFSCSEQKTDIIKKESLFRDTIDYSKLVYEKINVCLLTGDFNGDGKKDTLFQNNINRETGLPIDSFPAKYEWDTIVDYFYKNHADIILTLSIENCDTLHLGTGLGLFCLINIGDNNHDKKDEIALVNDGCDFTRVNHCYIYTLCNGILVELKSFYIHEGAFDIYDEVIPDKNKIEGFLEKKKGKWMYLDYMEDFAAEREEDVGKMKPLKLKSCK